jgi:hypothetical protein
MKREIRGVDATNSCAGGAKLIDLVLATAERSGRQGVHCYQHVPKGFKDWNDQLRGRR